MSKRTLEELKNEREVILGKIKNPPRMDRVAGSGNAYKLCRAMLKDRENYLKENENLRSFEKLSSDIELLSRRTQYQMDVLFLYRAAVKMHEAYIMQDNVPASLKEVSADNVRLFEQAMKEQGFTDEMMMAALEGADFHQKMAADCEKQAKALADAYVKENGPVLSDAVEINGDGTKLTKDDKITPEYVIGRALYHKNDKTKPPRLPAVDNISGDQRLYCQFSKLDPYFEGAATWDKQGAYDVGKEPYQFFVAANGVFMERPYPDNFFAKIGYFFKKLWNASTVRRERNQIERNEENLKKVLGEVPEELKEQPTVADVSDDVVTTLTAPQPQPEANRIESKEFTEGLKEAANDETPAPNNNDANEKTEENVASI